MISLAETLWKITILVVGAYIDPNSDVRNWVNFIFLSHKRPLNVDIDVDMNCSGAAECSGLFRVSSVFRFVQGQLGIEGC